MSPEDQKEQAQRIVRAVLDEMDTIPCSELPTRIDHRLEGFSNPALEQYLRDYYQVPAPATPLEPGTMIGGRYRIVAPLGTGGMGIVYQAEQLRIDRSVALKMIRPAMSSSESLARRMAEEISTLGRLDHPHIVRIFDADVCDDAVTGRQALYFTMEAVDGSNLRDWARSGDGQSLDAILACFARICDAVAFAHERGVIHRDLKPGNILVRPDGSPAIVDFGIASIREANAARAAGEAGIESLESQSISGTPHYMSPQKWQARDDLEAGDVFALGVILHELLAGQRPWKFPPNPSRRQIRDCILATPPQPLRDTAPNVDAGVCRLADRLLEPDSARRPSAGEVAEEVRHILRRNRRRAWVRRWAPAILGGSAVLLGAAGYGSWRLWLKNQRLISESDFREAVAALRQPGLDPAASLLEALPPSEAVRHDSDAWRAALVRAHTFWRFSPGGDRFPPGTEAIASDTRGERHLVAAGGDPALWIRKPDENRRVPLPPPLASEPIRLADFHPDRSLVAVKTDSGEIFLWDHAAGGPLHTLTTIDSGSRALAFSPNGDFLACGSTIEATAPGQFGARGIVDVWKVGEWEKPFIRLESPSPEPPVCGSVDRLAWHPREPILATTGRASRSVFLWDAGETGREAQPRCVLDHQAPVSALAWNHRVSHWSERVQPPLLATGRTDGIVSVWSLFKARSAPYTTPFLSFGGTPALGALSAAAPRRPTASLFWLPNGAEVLEVGPDGSAVTWALWEPSRPTREFSLPSNLEAAHWQETPPGLSLRVKASADAASSHFWSWKPGRIASDLFVPADIPWLHFDADGSHLAAGGPRGGRILQASPLRTVKEIDTILTGPPSLDPAGDGIWFFSRTDGLWHRRYHPEGPRDTHIWKTHTPIKGSMTQTPDGELVVYTKAREVHALKPGPGGSVNTSDSAPIFELDDAQMELTIDRSGKWLACNRLGDAPGRFRLYREDENNPGAWAEVGQGSPPASGIFGFGPDGRHFYLLRPPPAKRGPLALERWPWGFAGPGQRFRLHGGPPTPAGASNLLTADSSELLLADQGDGIPALIASGDGPPLWITRLDRGVGSGPSAMAISPDGSRAASARPCSSGTLITLWDLDQLRALLHESGFPPVPLEEDSATGLRGPVLDTAATDLPTPETRR